MLHLGIASWQNPHLLDRAIKSVQATTQGEFTLLIYDNASPDPGVRPIIEAAVAGDSRIIAEFATANSGYAGAVNAIAAWAQSEDAEFLGYIDNDIQIQTPGWDQIMLEVLRRHHDISWVFPKDHCAFPIPKQGYWDILWGLGCGPWIMKMPHMRQPPIDIGYMDIEIGHQQDPDLALRHKLEGWSLAGVDVKAHHEAHASTSPEAQARITKGVIEFYNKWLRRLVGPTVTYHSENVLRFDEWPVSAIHIEKYLKHHQAQGTFPSHINEDPELVIVEGRKYELIKVPRWPNLYRDRLV